MHKARDIDPRFSPDGRSIAFSSDREGNMDVYVIPAAGGAVKRLTIHSADDTVLDWTPDGKAVLFASQRGEDFMGKLYVVSDRRRHAPRRRARHGRRRLATRPTAPSWPSTARPRPTGGSTTAAPTRAT